MLVFEMESWTLAHIRGIPLRAHVTLLLAIPYFALVIASQFDAMASMAGIDGRQLWIPPAAWGGLLALGLVCAVALHEAAEALALRWRSRRITSITLMVLGGIAHVDPSGKSADRNEVVWPAGLLASLAASIALYLAYSLVNLPEDARFGLFYLSQINMTVAVFNLLPAFPLDGGKLLRSLLVRRFGLERGTRHALTVARGFALCFAVCGVLFANVVLLLISFLVFSAAASENRFVLRRRKLAGLTAADMMHQTSTQFEASLPVALALQRIKPEQWVPVVYGKNENGLGRVIGFVDEASLLAIEKDRREAVPVGFAVNADVPLVARAEPAEHVLDLIEDEQQLIGVVSEDGALEGVIDHSDLSRKVA